MFPLGLASSALTDSISEGSIKGPELKHQSAPEGGFYEIQTSTHMV